MNPIKSPAQAMLARAVVLALCGVYNAKLSEGGLFKGEALQQRVVTSLTEVTKDQAATQETIDLYKRAVGGDHEAKIALCGLRMEMATNYILASTDFSSFFETVSLANNERPVFQSTTKNEVLFRYIAQDGSARRRKITNPTTETLIDLKLLSSEYQKYHLFDIYNGDVSAAAQATFDIGRDLGLQYDKILFDLLDGSIDSFVTTGAEQNRTFKAHSRINVSNLPTTNLITLDDNSGSTKFRYKVLREIVRYCESWGNAFPDGPLAPTGVIVVPSKDIADLADEVTPTSTATNAVTEAVQQNFTQVDYLGRRWTLVPNNTLAPGYCYPKLNKPVGRVYLKPGMDQEDVRTFKMENYEERAQMKVVGSYVPESYRVRALKVRYRT